MFRRLRAIIRKIAIWRYQEFSFGGTSDPQEAVVEFVAVKALRINIESQLSTEGRQAFPSKALKFA